MKVHESNIPQNKNSFFFFKKNEYYKSIEILFEFTEEINFRNLFLSLKYYIHKEHYFLKYIFIVAHISINEDDKKNIPRFHNININKLKKMSFFDFKEWFSELLDNDWKYMQSYNFYGFSMVFYENSVLFNEKEFWPEYPWNTFFEKTFIPYNDVNELEKYENEIKKLKKKIFFLSKKGKNKK